MSNRNRNLWDEYKNANKNLTFDREGNLLRGNLSIEDYKIAANLYDSAKQEEELERQYKATASELEDQRVVDRQEQLALQERINKYMTQSQGTSGIDGTGVAEGLKLRANNAYNTALRDIDKQTASAQDDLYSKYVDANNELYNSTQTNNFAYLQEKATSDANELANKYYEVESYVANLEEQGKTRADISNYLESVKSEFGNNNTDFNILYNSYKDYSNTNVQSPANNQNSTSKSLVEEYTKNFKGESVNVNNLNQYFGSGKGGKQDEYFSQIKEDYQKGKIKVGQVFTPNLGAAKDYSYNYFMVTSKGIITISAEQILSLNQSHQLDVYVPDGYHRNDTAFNTGYFEIERGKENNVKHSHSTK